MKITIEHFDYKESHDHSYSLDIPQVKDLEYLLENFDKLAIFIKEDLDKIREK